MEFIISLEQFYLPPSLIYFSSILHILTALYSQKLKHLLTIFILGVIMQIVLYFAMNMTDFSIFLVFTVSIILIYIFME